MSAHVPTACKWKHLIAIVEIIVHVNNMTSKNDLHTYISPISEAHRANQEILYLFILCCIVLKETCRIIGTEYVYIFNFRKAAF